jgi:hypothetical protein
MLVPISIHSQVLLSYGRLDIAYQPDPLTLKDAWVIFPSADDFTTTTGRDAALIADDICELLRHRCGLKRSHEHLFLSLYFQFVEGFKSPAALSSALLPLPKARLFSVEDLKPITVDFAFWTGTRFVCIFIGENRQDAALSRDERLLKLWGFDVFRLQAEELETRGLASRSGARLLRVLHEAAL